LSGGDLGMTVAAIAEHVILKISSLFSSFFILFGNHYVFRLRRLTDCEVDA
jgi:hypothetical protein